MRALVPLLLLLAAAPVLYAQGECSLEEQTTPAHTRLLLLLLRAAVCSSKLCAVSIGTMSCQSMFLTAVACTVPTGATVLDFFSNSITAIPANPFPTATATLTSIYFDSNQISAITPGAFAAGYGSLRQLAFSDNRITYIAANT